ncbi:MAG: hypothetical protein ACRCSF_06000 [Mycobacteriaceae bacterium]
MKPQLGWSALITCHILLTSAVALPPHASSEPVVGQRIEQPLGYAGPGVLKSWVQIYSPLPENTPAHPHECDYVSYLRFRAEDGPAESSSADSVFTALAGIVSGPAQFDALAPEVVKQSHSAGRKVEFWSLQRRSMCYYDRTGLDAAATAGDYRVAIDYYFNHAKVAGKTFAGWPDPLSTIPMSADDFAQQNNDWYTAIADGVPDPVQRSKKVFCAGHSLAGFNLSSFAATEFGTPEHPDPGFSQCAGMVALDTSLTVDPLGLENKPILKEASSGLGDIVNLLNYAQSHTGIMPTTNDIPFLQGALADIMTIFSIAAIGAHFQPHEESELLQRLPRTPIMELVVRTLFAADHLQLLTNNPDVRSFRYTNEAMLGALLDNNSQPLTVAQFSFGTFAGGPLREKLLFLPESLANIPGTNESLPVIGEPLKNSALGANKVSPIDPTILYTWNNYTIAAEPDSTGRVYSTLEDEHTDIKQLAKSLFEGPALFFDPFFAMTQTINPSYITGSRFGNLSRITYTNGPFERPTLFIFGSAGSVSSSLDAVSPLLRFMNPTAYPIRPDDSVVGTGYTHLDVLMAAPKQNSGGASVTSTAITDFMLKNTD